MAWGHEDGHRIRNHEWGARNQLRGAGLPAADSKRPTLIGGQDAVRDLGDAGVHQCQCRPGRAPAITVRVHPLDFRYQPGADRLGWFTKHERGCLRHGHSACVGGSAGAACLHGGGARSEEREQPVRGHRDDGGVERAKRDWDTRDDVAPRVLDDCRELLGSPHVIAGDRRRELGYRFALAHDNPHGITRPMPLDDSDVGDSGGRADDGEDGPIHRRLGDRRNAHHDGVHTEPCRAGVLRAYLSRERIAERLERVEVRRQRRGDQRRWNGEYGGVGQRSHGCRYVRGSSSHRRNADGLRPGRQRRDRRIECRPRD